MNNFIINKEYVKAPPGLIVTNYIEDNEPRFKVKKRRGKLKNIVLHETAGRTAEGCKNTLLKKGYGVQLILARDGSLSCHGDLYLDRMSHAGRMNKTSLGIEVVNPYTPLNASRMRVSTIPAEWWTWCAKDSNGKLDRRYVLPSADQMYTLEVLIPWLCIQLGIPTSFPTTNLGPKRRKIKGFAKPPRGWRAKPKPGIVAHRDFGSHADGRYLLEYLMERM